MPVESEGRGVAPSIVEVVLSGAEEAGAAATTHRLLQLVSREHIFEFYIPDAVHGLEAADRFARRLGSLSEGVTLFRGRDGDWLHESEAVRVLRMSITTVRPDGTVLWTEQSIREAVANLVCELIVELRDLHGRAEEAIFFNDWDAQATEVRGHPERRSHSREEPPKLDPERRGVRLPRAGGDESQ